MNKAVVLLSGGLDSTTLLYFVKSRKYAVHCLIFDYGQRHKKEILMAQKIAREAGAAFDVVKIQMPWRGSALLDKKVKIPERKIIDSKEIPVTYVPARNIIFLSFAVSCAEAIGAKAVFIGANALDYSGYPDCRPDFFEAYTRVITTGTKAGVEGGSIKIQTPLIHKTKSQIIKMGLKLGVPYELTWSCYKGGSKPCGGCDSCQLRAKGFAEAGSIDPSL
ncbi:MAG: 7-cyano-7-deazaguanine synthase QueC [Candidatus Omnitrophica bacterium]|nr:7-cyano-7-deazaguanine synthase QueC [Candidatus Omnitrophota bacterium]